MIAASAGGTVYWALMLWTFPVAGDPQRPMVDPIAFVSQEACVGMAHRRMKYDTIIRDFSCVPIKEPWGKVDAGAILHKGDGR